MLMYNLTIIAHLAFEDLDHGGSPVVQYITSPTTLASA